ncbi:hypothetical protein LI951_09685 [Enterococcus sp. BWT-B8]|uniref:hypothetical protein n=1 Tax=Enterococcus sp. BWT-B8 TaxID=2885157 RepID=UPI001E5E4C5C|nr:hypothetical protein [Enterococcus sp. BWT-B8]MCB5952335.1 hypothetical protein [Enterococcus sp. BWT-B8]
MRKIWKLHKKLILSGTVITGLTLAAVSGLWLFKYEESESRSGRNSQGAMETKIKTSDQELKDEFLVYHSDGFMGLMDENGEIVLDAETERVKMIESLPNSSWFKCSRGDYTGFYFNTKNEWRIRTEEFSMDETSFVESNYSSYYNRETGNYGLISKDGKNIIEPGRLSGLETLTSKNNYFMTASFADGKQGVFNIEGELLGKKFDDVVLLDTFNEHINVVAARINKEEFGIFHSEEGLILSPEEVKKEGINFINSYGAAPVALYSTVEGMDGIIDREGKIVRDEEGNKLLFHYISNFSSNGYASARTLEDEAVIIDETGKIAASSLKFSEKEIHNIYGFNPDGKAIAVFLNDGKETYGMIDEKLTILSTIKNKEISKPSYLGQDLLSVRKNYNDESPALITSTGKELLSQEEAAEEEIIEIGPFTKNGLSVVANEEYDEGLLDKKGKILFPIEDGIVIRINQIKNIFVIERLNENNNTSEVIYTNIDGALLYKGSEDEQLLIGERRVMIVHSNGETEVFDENGRTMGIVKVEAD